jgi:murein DD-endopeptidase MepM/ murein hydrolase activator NlpD
MPKKRQGLYSNACFFRDFKWATHFFFIVVVVSFPQTSDLDPVLIIKFISNLPVSLSRASALTSRHHKRITALVAALLLGGGGGAFALASLAPDASELPLREVIESVQPLLSQAADRPLPAAMNLYRTDITRSSDTADTLLKRLGVADAGAAAFLRNDPLSQQLLLGRAGRNITSEVLSGHGLQSLTARWSPTDDGNFQRLLIERQGDAFSSRLETIPLSVNTQLASGTIQSSLFASTDDAGVPDAVAVQLAEIFSGDIDFHRALRKGDRFSVVYETLEGDGEALRTGRVLSAEFVNNGKTYQAIWFQNPVATNPGVAQALNQKGGYYTLDGQSLRRAFLASPMEFSRVTSGFKMRMHPILKTMRAHLGIDYGAPTGTSVRTIGNGVVEFAGVQNGFGNVIFIRHDNQNVTVYAHLSHIGVRKGQSVDQGQAIGAVGSTGWATGPHLHFEFRVNGQHQDPLTVAHQNQTIPLSAAVKPAFDLVAAQTKLALAAAATLHTGSAQ